MQLGTWINAFIFSRRTYSRTDDTITIYYLFYNQESEAISKTFKYKFINCDADIEIINCA
jgi:hypothetical protein